MTGLITDEMRSRKSAEWEAELETIRRGTAKHEHASHDYAVTGSKILELAKHAHSLFIQQNSQDQTRLLKRYFRTAGSIAEVFQLLTLSRSIYSSTAMKVEIGWVSGTISATI